MEAILNSGDWHKSVASNLIFYFKAQNFSWSQLLFILVVYTYPGVGREP